MVVNRALGGESPPHVQDDVTGLCGGALIHDVDVERRMLALGHALERLSDRIGPIPRTDDHRQLHAADLEGPGAIIGASFPTWRWRCPGSGRWSRERRAARR